ncbi:MAG: phosphatidylglycerophosphatase A [Nitrospirota bacterium]
MTRDAFLKHIATLGPIGHLPVAPGTWGSLAALLLYIVLEPSVIIQGILLLFLIPLGITASSSAERTLNRKDSKHIVIDEACGFLISVFFVPFSIGYCIAAFFLFRIFDILKPFPARKFETVFSGGLGIMADDIIAGMYANIILQIGNQMF